MPQALPASNILRVVTPQALSAFEDARAQEMAGQLKPNAAVNAQLASFIRTEYDTMRNHRSTNAAWGDRLISALRKFNGQYDPTKLAEIQKFGGSEVYARIVSMKCRGASSLLRDVYLSSDRPWDLEPPADPDVPQEIMDQIQKLVEIEAMSAQQAGMPPDPGKIRDRLMALVDSARMAAKKQAAKRTSIAEDRIEEMLQEGGFYRAFAEFLVDLPLFPFACIKGPVVRIKPTVVWENGQPISKQTPRMTWYRVSPFDLYWTPGVNDIEDAAIIERQRLTRADLNDLLDLPGYNHNAILEILDEYGRGGLDDNWDSTDAERAVAENRENPRLNKSGLIACLEYTGSVQGRMLREYGLSKKDVPDERRDYMISAWLIGRHIIKAQLHPNPRKRHPYFMTSFEKVPGTPVGNALPDILADVEDVCNATLRSLVNNLSISSGPQVVVRDDRLSIQDDGDDLYPWKRWHVTGDPSGLPTSSGEKPIDFFQPNSNASELLGVYKAFSEIADELSAIPKYMSGAASSGGAGRTASGLAMLMGNASKILQTVAANIDRDVLEPLLASLYDMVMLTDRSGLFTGQEAVRVKGVVVAVQRETQRARQLEFLQTTANPIDMQIMGQEGRAVVLESVSKTLGLDGERIVPSQDELKKRQQEAQQQAMMQQAAMGGQPGMPPGAPGQPQPGAPDPAAQAQGMQQSSPVTGDMGPRTNLQQATPKIAGGVA
jgi:hypothetical protein